MRKCSNSGCENEVSGRIDRKFCSTYCKTDFHYQKRKEKKHTYLKKEIDDIIRKNRKILSRYNLNSKTTLRKEELLTQGFNPRFFTHYWKNQQGDTYLFCYDKGFKEVKDNNRNKYVLIQWQDYMAHQLGID